MGPRAAGRRRAIRRPRAYRALSAERQLTAFQHANGNLTSGAGRTLTWPSFNAVASVVQGANTLTFPHDTEHQRARQEAPSTTLYIAGLGLKVEKFTGSGGAVRWNNYVYAAGGIVAVYYEIPAGTSLTRYFHKDHLGSTAAITDEAGLVVERDGYDAWGKRRHPGGADDTSGTLEGARPTAASPATSICRR